MAITLPQPSKCFHKNNEKSKDLGKLYISFIYIYIIYYLCFICKHIYIYQAFHQPELSMKSWKLPHIYVYIYPYIQSHKLTRVVYFHRVIIWMEPSKTSQQKQVGAGVPPQKSGHHNTLDNPEGHNQHKMKKENTSMRVFLIINDSYSKQETRLPGKQRVGRVGTPKTKNYGNNWRSNFWKNNRNLGTGKKPTVSDFKQIHPRNLTARP